MLQFSTLYRKKIYLHAKELDQYSFKKHFHENSFLNYFSTIVAFFREDFGLKYKYKQIEQHFFSSELQTSTEEAGNSNLRTTQEPS